MPMEKLRRNNTHECLWPYILRILKDKPSHGYVLRKEIERRFGFKPGKVTAYLVLYSLTKKGYVEKKKIGRRQVYRITSKGRELLRKAVNFYSERARILR